MEGSKLTKTVSIIAACALAIGCARAPKEELPLPTPPTAFQSSSDYTVWSSSEGVENGYLTIDGTGLYANPFLTPKTAPGYDSGRIVIGDSRCCQLGIYLQRSGGAAFASFAVWGGHYLDGAYPQIMSDALISAVEDCFRAQIDRLGKCRVFFYATVNDYSYGNAASNDANIAAAVKAAERIASMEYTKNGVIHRPEVTLIGFDGFQTDIYPNSEFNIGLSDYSSSLKSAVQNSALLGKFADSFTTVPAITAGSTTYIDDGLHYSDETLEKLIEYMLTSSR